MATGEVAVRVHGLRRAAGGLSATGRLFRRKPLGAAGFLVLVVMVFLAIFAPLVAQEDPLRLSAADIFKSPSGTHFFGTDNFGRDIFSRIVHGSRISLYVGFLSVLIGTTGGAIFGLISGYRMGPFDLVGQRVMDALLAMPGLILAIMIVFSLGATQFNVVLAISINIFPSANRVLRSQCLTVKERQYVDAARAMGASDQRIMFRHILPNALAPYLIIATAALGGAILTEASLSFLGLGVPPPAPSWGGMLSGGLYVREAPWMALAPGIALTLAVFGFNMMGDALRDILDPRLRGR